MDVEAAKPTKSPFLCDSRTGFLLVFRLRTKSLDFGWAASEVLIAL